MPQFLTDDVSATADDMLLLLILPLILLLMFLLILAVDDCEVAVDCNVAAAAGMRRTDDGEDLDDSVRKRLRTECGIVFAHVSACAHRQ